jgi:hypothetical protein
MIRWADKKTTKYAKGAKVEAERIAIEIKAVKTLADERFVNQPFSRLSRFS